MNEGTINAEVTMGGAVGVLLVNRYRVLKQLGQGGMGSVWLAEDTKLDGRKVAVKMLPSILVSNKRAYAQVKQEALVSLKLTHSNIVAVRASSVRSTRLLRSEKIDTFENLLTPVMKVKRWNSCAYLMTP